jgi:methylated-DNA-[protein]-cysteine S-methyltransferase
MAQQLNYVVFNTDMGWLGILGSAAGLRRITLPRPFAQEIPKLLVDSSNQAVELPHLFQDIMERLRQYFRGQPMSFPDKLDLSGATPFQRQVWETARLIPYSETRSYGWVAEQIKKPLAARAVGQALGKNPLPIIVPCHRVLSGNGQLGGFTGGLDTKVQLLTLEGAAGFR